MNTDCHHWTHAVEEVQADNHIHPWLCKPYVISKAMKQCCENFSLQLLEQKPGQTFTDEREWLNCSEEITLVRKVFLKGDEVPWSFGRVVVPSNTYQQFKTTFDELGGKLIGEDLLYGNPDTSRSKFQFIRLSPQQPLYQDLLGHLKKQLPSHIHYPNPLLHHLWGRRSIFSIGEFPLLVTEIYLPWVAQYPELEHAD